jgi:electron transfer flavoprotein alpha subunit
MAAIFVYSENDAIARQLLASGLELKATMQIPLCVLTTNAGESDNFIHSGAEKVFVLDAPGAWPEGLAKVIADLAGREQASVLLVGGTLRGKDLAAKVAALLKAGLVSDVQLLKFDKGSLQTTRLLYAGLALCEETVALPAVVTVPPRTFAEPAPSADLHGVVQTIEAAPDTRVVISNMSPIKSEGVDITAASRLVSVGRGFQHKEDLGLARELAKTIGAEIACSRPIAEECHWLPIERYIGISGQQVKPELYLAVGISGQVQHVVGIRSSKFIVAVNSDERAPIFEAADYGIVGDLYQVLPLLTKALKH